MKETWFNFFKINAMVVWHAQMMKSYAATTALRLSHKVKM
jgi:hypothetical protein